MYFNKNFIISPLAQKPSCSINMHCMRAFAIIYSLLRVHLLEERGGAEEVGGVAGLTGTQ